MIQIKQRTKSTIVIHKDSLLIDTCGIEVTGDAVIRLTKTIGKNVVFIEPTAVWFDKCKNSYTVVFDPYMNIKSGEWLMDIFIVADDIVLKYKNLANVT